MEGRSSRRATRVSPFLDLRTAGVLGLAFGLTAAATMPFLIELVPADQRQLPLPLPLFALALVPILGIQYAVYAFAGCRAARKAHIEPAPVWTALWQRTPLPPGTARETGLAFVWGLGAGLAITLVTLAVQAIAPTVLPSTLHPGTIPAALGASASAAIGEEILCRLLILSLLAWALGSSLRGRTAAVLLAALIFGALHAPAMVFLFGGLPNVPAATWIWLLVLNGVVGAAAGVAYLRGGFGAAAISHFAADLVWHVGSVAVGL